MQNILRTTHNLRTRQWIIDQFDIILPKINLEFSFISDEVPVSFNNLSFGIIVQQAGNIVYFKTFPNNGMKYISTDQIVLEQCTLDLLSNTEYKLTFWVDDTGLRTDYVYDLVVPFLEPAPDYEVE